LDRTWKYYLPGDSSVTNPEGEIRCFLAARKVHHLRKKRRQPARAGTDRFARHASTRDANHGSDSDFAACHCATDPSSHPDQHALARAGLPAQSAIRATDSQ